MPVRAPPGILRLVLVNALVPSVRHLARVISAVHLHLCLVAKVAPLFGGIEVDVRDDLCRLREILVAKVASEDRW